MVNNRCPFCGALTFANITLPPGTSYTLILVDQSIKPPVFKPD